MPNGLFDPLQKTMDEFISLLTEYGVEFSPDSIALAMLPSDQDKEKPLPYRIAKLTLSTMGP